MRKYLIRLILATGLFLSMAPAMSRAADGDWFQWGTEGSYMHQVSHLLFLAALIFFIVEMRRGRLAQQRGFHLFTWACGILAVWNLDAVIGHALDWSLMNPVILDQGWQKRLLMEDLHTWLFYLTKLDHFLLLAPAFYLFYRGLQIISQGPPSRTS